jgi:hypothetical protein
MTDAANMKAYVDPRPQSKIGMVRIALMILLEQHLRDQAIPTSVRFLFYELIARRIVAKSGERPDKIVSEAVTDLREHGQYRGSGSSTRLVRSRTSPARQPLPKTGSSSLAPPASIPGTASRRSSSPNPVRWPACCVT